MDADACPNVVKEILFRAAARVEVDMILFANQPIRIPPSRRIKFIQVPKGFDVADAAIVEKMMRGDLVITGDIPLAAEVIEKGGHALNPRGEMYTTENVKDFLARRNFMDELRSTGQVTGGPPPLGKPEQQRFANALDRFLSQKT